MVTSPKEQIETSIFDLKDIIEASGNALTELSHKFRLVNDYDNNAIANTSRAAGQLSVYEVFLTNKAPQKELMAEQSVKILENITTDGIVKRNYGIKEEFKALQEFARDARDIFDNKLKPAIEADNRTQGFIK